MVTVIDTNFGSFAWVQMIPFNTKKDKATATPWAMATSPLPCDAVAALGICRAPWHMEASHQGLQGVSSPRIHAVEGCLLLSHRRTNLVDWKPDGVLLLLLLESLQLTGHWAGMPPSLLAEEEYSCPNYHNSHYHNDDVGLDRAGGVCAAGPMFYFLLKGTALGPGQAFLLSPAK